MKISIADIGYVGLSKTILLVGNNEFLDIELNTVKAKQSFVYDMKNVLQITKGCL